MTDTVHSNGYSRDMVNKILYTLASLGVTAIISLLGFVLTDIKSALDRNSKNIVSLFERYDPVKDEQIRRGLRIERLEYAVEDISRRIRALEVESRESRAGWKYNEDR